MSIGKPLSLLLAIVLVTSFVSHADARCTEPDKVLGTMDFTTVVLGAKRSSAIGVNGYYRVEIATRSCEPVATIVKLGFSKVIFPERRLQYGAFPVKIVEAPLLDGYDGNGTALFVDAELASNSGSSLSIGFTFVGQSGFWRYLGDDWDSAGMWGALKSVGVDSLRGGRFKGPRPLSCDSWKLKSGGTKGVAIQCDDLIIASPAMDKPLFWAPKTPGAGGAYFTKVAKTGKGLGAAWMDVCTDWLSDNGSDHRSVKRLSVDGRSVRELATTDAASYRKCGLRPPTKRSKGRWGGTIQ